METLQDELICLKVPPTLSYVNPSCKDNNHSEDRDGFALDVMGSLIEASHQTIPMTGGGKSRDGKSRSTE